MALGLKTRKAAVNDNVAAQAGTSPANVKKRKPAEQLRSVVNESEVGAAIDVLKKNTPFALPNGCWVVLLLPTAAIGGLGTKWKNDRDKGSIVELITADTIEVVVTAEMLDEEIIGIIPTQETLRRMDEFTLLRDAKYAWATMVPSNGGTALEPKILPNMVATHADAMAVAEGHCSLAELLPVVWEWAEGSGNATPESSPALDVVPEPVLPDALEVAPIPEPVLELPPVPTPPVATAVVASSASTPSFDEDPLSGVLPVDYNPDGGVDYAALADEGGGEPEVFVDESDSIEVEVDYDDDTEEAIPAQWSGEDEVELDDDYTRYVAANKSREVDIDEVNDTIARRFFSGDLDLVVDLAEFEKVFTTQAPTMSVITGAEAPTDWLGGKVVRLQELANTELAQLHANNADVLRQTFVETMSLHVGETLSAVSTEREGTQFYDLMVGAKRDFDTARDNAPQEMAALRRELTERFDAGAQVQVDRAAAHARAVYDDRHRPRLENDLAKVASEIDQQQEERYNHAQQIVQDMRRKDAHVRMDIGTTRVMQLVRELQDEQREAERVCLEKWSNTITQFIDENRKEDIARARALDEELARDTQIVDLRAEHTHRIAEIRAEALDHEQRLESELVKNRQAALSELEARDRNYQAALQQEQQRTADAQALTEELRAQMLQLGNVIDQQYQSKINELQASKNELREDKRELQADIANSAVMQRRTIRLIILLMVGLTIAGLLVGAVLGWGWGGQNASNALDTGQSTAQLFDA